MKVCSLASFSLSTLFGIALGSETRTLASIRKEVTTMRGDGDLATWIKPAHYTHEIASSGIWTLDNLLSESEVDYILSLASSNRTAWKACTEQYSNREQDLLAATKTCKELSVVGDNKLKGLWDRMNGVWNTTLPTDSCIELIRYGPGTPGTPKHHDADPDNVPSHGTLAVYLSDSSAKTVFPDSIPSAVMVTPKRGSASTWLTVDPLGPRLRPVSRHGVEANPHTEGERIIIHVPVFIPSVTLMTESLVCETRCNDYFKVESRKPILNELEDGLTSILNSRKPIFGMSSPTITETIVLPPSNVLNTWSRSRRLSNLMSKGDFQKDLHTCLNACETNKQTLQRMSLSELMTTFSIDVAE